MKNGEGKKSHLASRMGLTRDLCLGWGCLMVSVTMGERDAGTSDQASRGRDMELEDRFSSWERLSR